MQSRERYVETIPNDDERGLAEPQSSEEVVDRLGMRASLLVLCVGLLIAAVWMVSRPSFEKCPALKNATERQACYDNLRAELLKPPAKGAEAPVAALRWPR
jgi:hypothetical protein